MARIRTIKPSFWGDEAVASLSFNARLLLVGLISFADDKGRFIATESAIAGYVFPYDKLRPNQLRNWLNEIAAVRNSEGKPVVIFYAIKGREYGAFTKWRHQRISKPQPSSLPAPPAAELDLGLDQAWNDTEGLR